MAIVEMTELGLERDQFLFAKWGVNRVELEDYYQRIHNNPDVPQLAQQETEESMHILDVMLVRSVGRMRFWGRETGEQTLHYLTMIEELVHSAQHPENVRDCDKCNPLVLINFNDRKSA